MVFQGRHFRGHELRVFRVSRHHRQTSRRIGQIDAQVGGRFSRRSAVLSQLQIVQQFRVEQETARNRVFLLDPGTALYNGAFFGI